ncbi:MAG: HNH endonuclease signature motif containing protein [Vicinamibacterales bacterium]
MALPEDAYKIDGVWYRAGKRCWTRQEDAIIRRRYPHEKAAQLRDVMPWRPLSSIHKRAGDLGVKKTAAFMASPEACRLRRGDHVGAAFRFTKGQTPANKGLRRPGYSVGRGRMQETQFKKGIATNWHPIGSTRLVDGYLYRKVSDIRNITWTRNWKQEHYLIWEAAHGPIPKGHNVCFKDGDRTHVTLDNLALVSRRTWMKRHTVHNLPKPLAQTIQLLGALTRTIRRKDSRNGDQKRD